MKTNSILLLIFLATVIPTIFVYTIHGREELEAHLNAKSETKAIKTLGEATLFFSIAIGYALCLWATLFFPKYRIPYIVIIVGTIGIVILYYLRIYGIPIPGTDIVITDLTADWRDVVTKICQQILVVPVAILLSRIKSEQDNQQGIQHQ